MKSIADAIERIERTLGRQDSEAKPLKSKAGGLTEAAARRITARPAARCARPSKTLKTADTNPSAPE